jgi:hypothetical protein
MYNFYSLILTYLSYLPQRIYYQARQSLSGSDTISLYKPIICALDWRSHLTHGSADILDKKYDIILLTDCIFSLELLDDIVSICFHQAGPKTTVICCHERRDEVIYHSPSHHSYLNFTICML